MGKGGHKSTSKVIRSDMVHRVAWFSKSCIVDKVALARRSGMMDRVVPAIRSGMVNKVALAWTGMVDRVAPAIRSGIVFKVVLARRCGMMDMLALAIRSEIVGMLVDEVALVRRCGMMNRLALVIRLDREDKLHMTVREVARGTSLLSGLRDCMVKMWFQSLGMVLSCLGNPIPGLYCPSLLVPDCLVVYHGCRGVQGCQEVLGLVCQGTL